MGARKRNHRRTGDARRWSFAAKPESQLPDRTHALGGAGDANCEARLKGGDGHIARHFLQIVLLQPGNFHERPKQTFFQRLIPVDRNHDSFASARHREDVVATVNPRQFPTVPLNDFGEVPTRDLLHTVTSNTRSAVPAFGDPSSASSHPSIASRMFVRTSSIVSPCDTQPGSAGTSAQ